VRVSTTDDRQIEDAYLVTVFSPVSLVSAYCVESTRCQT